MKKIFLLALFLLGCGGGRDLSKVEQVTNVGNNQQITVFINNLSSMPADRVQRYIVSQNIQLQRDFRPAWNVDAVCQFGQAPANIRTVTFLPGFSGQNVPGNFIGYHNNLRQGFVDFGRSEAVWFPETVASHEVLELLMNEYVDPGGYEVCDPVNNHYYSVEGVNMADFVLPNYYLIGSAGPWDHLGLVTRAFTPTPGNSNFVRGHSELVQRKKREKKQWRQ